MTDIIKAKARILSTRLRKMLRAALSMDGLDDHTRSIIDSQAEQMEREYIRIERQKIRQRKSKAKKHAQRIDLFE